MYLKNQQSGFIISNRNKMMTVNNDNSIFVIAFHIIYKLPFTHCYSLMPAKRGILFKFQ